MSSLPLVSVIIPTYNREHCLAECVNSVTRQTYRTLEVLIVDDGSRDNTRGLVEGLQASDSRIRYLSQENGGVSAARNTGLRAAQGELFAFLDSDDLWYPWKLELQMAALQRLPQAGMVWTDMAAIDERGACLYDRFLRRMYGAYKKLGDTPLFQQSLGLDVPPELELNVTSIPLYYGNIYGRMLTGNLVHTSTVLLRRERALLAGFFNEGFRRGGEDYGYHLRTCRHGDVAYLDISSIEYRIGAQDQLTHRRNQIEFARAFLATIEAEVRANGSHLPITFGELRTIFAEAHSWLGAELRMADRPSEALPHLMRAILLRPRMRYPWGQLARIWAPTSIRQLIKKIIGRKDLACRDLKHTAAAST